METIFAAIVGAVIALAGQAWLLDSQKKENIRKETIEREEKLRERRHKMLSDLKEELLEFDSGLDKVIVRVHGQYKDVPLIVGQEEKLDEKNLPLVTGLYKELDIILAGSGDETLIALRKKLATRPEGIPEAKYGPPEQLVHFSKVIMEAVEYLGKTLY